MVWMYEKGERSDGVYAVSGMVGLGQWVVAKLTNHLGRVTMSSAMSVWCPNVRLR